MVGECTPDPSVLLCESYAVSSFSDNNTIYSSLYLLCLVQFCRAKGEKGRNVYILHLDTTAR